MKILLFGSTGMVGTAVESICAKKNIGCIGLSHKDVEITDTNKVKKLIEQYKPDVVFNSVAVVGINLCEEQPDLAFAVNATAVLNLANICEDSGSILVQPSSHAVFDGTKDDYYTENDSPRITGIYSASKYLSECFAANICKRHYVVRFPTLFGDRRNAQVGFFDKVLRKIFKGEELMIADDKIDSPTYTMDAAEAVILLLEKQYPCGIYHIANSGKISYFDFVSKIRDLLNSNVRIIRAKDRDFNSRGYKPLKTAMKSVKIEPLRSWEDALYAYIMKGLKGPVK
jgi:dTDP-4-dehydrorhamnose reductase